MNADTSTQIMEDEAPVVFIVDDDEAVRDALTLVISMHGWVARPCASAGEFLQTYTGQQPACLLLDLAMQGMNGAELLEALKSASKSLPAIVVTAHQDHPMAKRALKAGAIAVVSKPFRNEELTALIQSVLPARS
ncbi:MAG: response regulator transcription factor [Gammaproteobacteria bacterium]